MLIMKNLRKDSLQITEDVPIYIYIYSSFVGQNVLYFPNYLRIFIYIHEGRSESKERFAIQRYLLKIGKKQNMQVLSHTFTYFST